MQPENKSFLDTKSIVVFIFAGAFLFGWQYYLGKKYPPSTVVPQAVSQNVPVELSKAVTPSTNELVAPGIQGGAKLDSASEQFEVYSDDNISFKVSSIGMGIKDIILKKYFDSNKANIKIGDSDLTNSFEIKLTQSQQLPIFALKQVEPGHFVGISEFENMTFKRDLKFNPVNFSLESKIEILNPTSQILSGISLFIPEKIHANKSSSFFMPSYNIQDFFLFSNAKKESVNYGTIKEDINKEFDNVSMLSSGTQYFTSAFLDKSEILPSVKLNASASKLSSLAEIIYKPTQLNSNLNFSQIFYFGPKSGDLLKSVNANFENIIDYGFFSVIAHPLVHVLKWFYSLVGNWGWAIILLTIFVRLFVLPFNVMSFKSMKAMKVIQPEIQKLKEKHKDDPLTLNKEMMSLMKKNGANPLGGCLPMLLQIPVFFALFKVIGNTVELYHAPFFGWLSDLSSPDAFFILPILMGITMFLQQKMTPSTMDPAQAKIMAVLPLVFSVFMISTPSGLTLYMFVSGLFGIIQQYLFMNNKTA